jgi:hypothetical protein
VSIEFPLNGINQAPSKNKIIDPLRKREKNPGVWGAKVRISRSLRPSKSRTHRTESPRISGEKETRKQKPITSKKPTK